MNIQENIKIFKLLFELYRLREQLQLMPDDIETQEQMDNKQVEQVTEEVSQFFAQEDMVNFGSCSNYDFEVPEMMKTKKGHLYYMKDGVKNYVCQWCSYSTIKYKALGGHVQKIHSVKKSISKS